MGYQGISRGPTSEKQIEAQRLHESRYETGYSPLGWVSIRCRGCGKQWPMLEEHNPGCWVGAAESGEAK